MKKFIFDLQRFLNIRNYDDYGSVKGTQYSDDIKNYGKNLKVIGYEGSDTITNYGSRVSISGDAGNDYIYNSSANFVTITGGTGNDRISNYHGENVNIIAGDGADSISNNGKNSTINGGDGKDTVSNSGNNVDIVGGAGSDSIYNGGDKVKIIGGDDSDTIKNNDGNYATIDGGNGNDSITNNGNNVSIDGGVGDDSINNSIYGNNVTITGGEGNDFICNKYGNNVKIIGGSGNDKISLGTDAKYNVIQYTPGAGNDTIYGFNSTNTLSITGGSYSTQESGNDVLVNVGSGSIKLVGVKGKTFNINGTQNSTSTMSGGGSSNPTTSGGGDSNPTTSGGESENDSISTKTEINGTEDADDIYCDVEEAIINAGAGNDNVYVDRVASVEVNAPSGDNFIYLKDADSANVSCGSGEDYIQAIDSDYVTVNAGHGNDSIFGDYYNSSINFGSGDNIGSLNACEVTILGNIGNTFGNNTILGSYNSSSINLGTGDDILSLNDISSVIYTGAGDNSVFGNYYNSRINFGSWNNLASLNAVGVKIKGSNSPHSRGSKIFGNYLNSSIIGGIGNDTIKGSYRFSSIDGGGGNNIINFSGNGNTIYGGFSNDTIYSADSGNLYHYESCSGEDVIYGFTSQDTLKVWGSSYFIETVGNDVVVHMYGSSLTLKNCANTALNIDGTLISSLSNISAIDGNIGTFKDSTSIIRTTPVNDIISVTGSASSARIYLGAGNDFIRNQSGYNTIYGGYGNDSIYNFIHRSSSYSNESSVIYGNAGKDIIVNSTPYATIYGGDDDDEITNESSYLVGNDYWTGNCDYAFIDGGNGNDIIFVGGHNVVVNGGADNDTIRTGSWNNIIIGGTGNDFISDYHDNTYIYTSGDGNDTISNYSTASTLQIVGSSYTTLKSGEDLIVKVGKGSITLQKFADKTPNIVTVKADSTEDLIDMPIPAGKFIPNKSSNVSVSGGNKSDVIKNWGTNNTIYGGADNDRISNLGDSVTIDGGTGNDEIYNRGSNIVFKYSGGKDLINGFNETSTLQIGDGTGNYSTTKAGDDIIVTVGKGNVTLNGAANLSKTNIIGVELPTWKLKGTTATYSTSKKILATVKGLKSGLKVSDGKINGVSVSGSKITLSKAALGTDKVTVSKGYTLALGKDVTQSKTTKDWKLNKTTATYKQTTTAGYKLANNSITHLEKSTKTLATVKGLKSGLKVSDGKINGVSVSDSKITLSKAALGKDKVTVSKGYTLALGKDVTQSKTTKDWKLNKTTATYKQTTTAGYKLANNSITHLEKSTKTLATVKGLKSGLKVSNGKINGVSVSNSKITLSKAALGTDKVTVSKGYTLALGKVVTQSKTTKDWKLKKTTATYKQTTTAGYKLANNSITHSEKSTKTLATIKGVKSLEGISLKKKVITISDSALNKSKVTVSKGYTLALGKDVTQSKTTNDWKLKKTTATYKQTTTAGYKLANNSITHLEKSTKTLATVNGVKSLDGISLKKKVVTLKASELNKKVSVSGKGYEFNFAAGDYKKSSIMGSKNADIITSRGKNISINTGEGNDTIKILGAATKVNSGDGNDIIESSGTGKYSLWGGVGNDTLYSGDGADKFYYAKGDGKDTIFGFDDKDTLTLDNLDFVATYSEKNQAVTFKVEGGSITLKDFNATTFHVNNDTYQIISSKFKKK